MSSDYGRLRVGDDERDEAMHLLREHYAQGRITAEEFDSRTDAALQARTGAELTALFEDLPGRSPQLPAKLETPTPAPMQYQSEPQEVAQRNAFARPWFVQIVLLGLAIIATVLSRGELVWMIPLAALWIWVVPFFKNRDQPVPPRREISFAERQIIVGDLRQRRKIVAIKNYREFTGAGLKEAKDAVEQIERTEII